LNAPLDDELMRLKALDAIQSADVSSLLNLLSELREALLLHLPQLSAQFPEVGERFLQLRKQFLHAQLEHIERSTPSLAAQLQQTIDEYCKHYPFDYD
jgi:hypothetical protein